MEGKINENLPNGNQLYPSNKWRNVFLSFFFVFAVRGEVLIELNGILNGILIFN